MNEKNADIYGPNLELLDGAREIRYKEAGGHDLSLFLFEPEGPAPLGGRPVGLFFFSSFWDRGLVGQFAPQCMYFASRGMTSIAVDYRVSHTHGTGPLEAMADARSAIRWVRLNASQLGIDPQKVIAFGGSGGGQIATAAALFPSLDEIGEDTSVSAVPDALVLFSPILDISKKGVGVEAFESPKIARAMSPLANIRKELPPMLICHALDDRRIPFRGAAEFTRKMRRKKNTCQLIEFDGHGHGFFNFNVSMSNYELTLGEAERFLIEENLLEVIDDAGEQLLAEV